MLSPATVEAIRAALQTAETILVITHLSPDGDAISSLTATGLALQQLSKSFTLVCDDAVPEQYLFLPFSNHVLTAPSTIDAYDLILALDAGDPDRLGRAYTDLAEPRPLIVNIDHHITNTGYGSIDLVRPEASSTTEILSHLLPLLGVQITPQLATCLLTGLVTDTLSFSTANVTANTLLTASKLVEAGADLFMVTSNSLKLKPLSTILLWQKGFNNLKLEEGLLWTSVDNADRVKAGYEENSSSGLSNLLSDVLEVAISAVLLELGDGRVKVGFRCRPPFTVSDLAKSLGGGGHDLAAGCTLEGSLQDVESLVIGKAKETIRQQRLAQAPAQRNN